MKCLTKDEANEEFGTLSFFQKNGTQTLIAKIEYFCGVDLFDENKLFSSPVVLYMRPKGLIISSLMKSKIQIGILDENINYIVIEHKENIVGKKDKSIIGRAVIGGVLLGPLGAIIGGMSGIGEKEIKSKAIPDNIVSISYKDNLTDKIMSFSLSTKNFKATEEYFIRHYKNKYKTAVELF